jgi:hypothetical protein
MILEHFAFDEPSSDLPRVYNTAFFTISALILTQSWPRRIKFTAVQNGVSGLL